MTETTKKKRGRPKGSVSSNTATKSLSNVRVTEEQLNTYKAAAEREGETFSAWVRNTLDKKAKI